MRLGQLQYQWSYAHDKTRSAQDVWDEKWQLLLDSFHPKQRGLATDPNRRVCARVARGAGKTTSIKARYARRGQTTNRARMLYVAVTRGQAIDLMWDPIKESLERLSIPYRAHNTDLRLRFLDTDSTLRLVGADDRRQIEKYRGIPFHEVWVDEAASFSKRLLKDLIYRIIGPRLGDFGGMLGLAGTPNFELDGEFYEVTRSGSPMHRRYEERELPEFEGWSGWSFHHWTLEAGAPHIPAMARLWEEALLEKKTNGWDDKHPVWLTEYMAEWARDDTEHVFAYYPHDKEGNPLNQWDPEKIPLGPDGLLFAKLPEGLRDWRYILAFDYGEKDPFALGVYAFSPEDELKRLLHVYEVDTTGMYAQTIAKLLLGEGLRHDSPGGIFGAVGWPDAMVADAPPNLLKELSEVYGIHVELADRRREARAGNIALTNGDFISGRLRVLKGSKLETQLSSLQWDKDDFGERKKDKRQRDDQADQFIYARAAAHHLFGEAVPTPKVDPNRPPPEPVLPERGDDEAEEWEQLLSDGDFDDEYFE